MFASIDTIIIFGLGVVAILFALLLRSALARRTRARLFAGTLKSYQLLLSETRRLVQAHVTALRSQYRSKTYTDAYGRLVLDDWHREVTYFVNNLVIPELDSRGVIGAFMQWRNSYALAYFHARYPAGEINRFAGEIDAMLELVVHSEFQSLLGAGDAVLTAMNLELTTGDDFERFCANCLEQAGWSVTHRGGSGDQGIDLIAAKDGVRVGLQCKLLSKPAGNEAAQQAFTGAQILALPVAAVVSNSGYTPGARVAAQATGVLLLSPDDMTTLLESRALPSRRLT